MAKVVLTLAATAVAQQEIQLSPGAASLSGIHFSLGNASIPAQTIAGPAPYEATFNDVPEGVYTAAAQPIDNLGNLVGGAVVVTVVVPAAPPAAVTVTGDQPIGPLTFTVS